MSDKKTYSFGNLGKKDDTFKTFDEIQYIEPKKDPYLYDYQKQVMDDLYKKYLSNPCTEITLPHTSISPQITTKPANNTVVTTKSTIPTSSLTIKDLQDMMKLLGPSYKPYSYGYGDYDTYFKAAPRVSKSEKKVEVEMEDGSVESISRENLIKYISEQRIVRENEVVRKVYERYQVAVKLVRSDDNGDTGV
jgi:hypothetical protein